jgi:hypothetical protein
VRILFRANTIGLAATKIKNEEDARTSPLSITRDNIAAAVAGTAIPSQSILGDRRGGARKASDI